MGKGAEFDLLGERLPAGVHLEDLLAPLAVGAIDDDLAIDLPAQKYVSKGLVRGIVGRAVAHLDGIGAARDLDHRRAVHQAGEPCSVDRRRHHQQLQILA